MQGNWPSGGTTHRCGGGPTGSTTTLDLVGTTLLPVQVTPNQMRALLAQLALHNPHIWANSLKPVCFLCFLLFWCPLLPFIETGTLKIYTKMVLYMKNEIFDLKYPLHGV